MQPDHILETLLPTLIDAAQYSKRIQPLVRSRPDKDGDMFKSALSDADLSVQTAVEVAILAKLPGVAFFGEEMELSHNAPYFPRGELTVLLDPVDGTRFFLDGHPNYQVVCSVVSGTRFEAAIALYPHRERYLCAVRGRGVVQGTFTDTSLSKATSYTLSTSHSTVLLGGNAGVELPSDFDWIAMRSYYQEKGHAPNLGDFLWGELGAVASRSCPLIDWGALAFIAETAGALATNWQGVPLPEIHETAEERAYPSCLVAVDPSLHERLVKVLSAHVGGS